MVEGTEMSKLMVSKHNQWFKVNEENFLLLNPFSGALDVVDQEVIDLIDYVQTHSQFPSQIDRNDQIVSLLLNRGYFLTSSDEERKRALAFEKVLQSFHHPGFLLIPTYNCNFRCPYCYEQNLRKKPKEFLEKILSEDQLDSFFQAVDSILAQAIFPRKSASKQVAEVILYGGEPFLPQTREIVEKIGVKLKKRNWLLGAITNGYHLEEFLPILRENHFTHLQITLDGPKEIHNNRRFLIGRKPTFDKIVAGIDKASNAGISIVLRMNLDSENINHLPAFLTFCDEKGWTQPESKIYISLGLVTTYSCKYRHSLSPVEYYRTLHTILGDCSRFTGALTNFIGFLKPQTPPDNPKSNLPQFPKLYYCGANALQRIFDPHGHIYPCWGVVGDPTNAIGKYDHSGYRLFESEIKKWNRSVLDLPKCSKCSYALICSGGCLYKALSTGQDHSSSFCGDFPQIFEEFVPRHIIARMKDKNSPWFFEPNPPLG
ncbi:MAG: radical SAM protein [Candidatus Hermodarchaeota archaeon]